MTPSIGREREVEGVIGFRVWVGFRKLPSTSEILVLVVERLI